MSTPSAPGKGAWINAAAMRSLQSLASRYSDAAGRVGEASSRAARTEILDPMAEAIRSHPATAGRYDHVADSLHVFASGDNLYAGVPSGHDAHADAVGMEYGDDDNAPAPHLRSHFLAYGDRAVETFHDLLWGGWDE